MRRLLVTLLSSLAVAAAELDIYAPPHSYYERPVQDRFTRLMREVEAGRVNLDRSGELAFLRSLLQALEVPASSQMLVFSTTSLQLSLISPRNPRALYFNEDTYVGYIPGGKIEVISLDPDLGGIFHIMDVPRNTGAPLSPERSRRCMNCHSGADSRFVPGLVIKSVIPGPTGGSLDAFRNEDTGHQIPLAERFGGWYVTGLGEFTNHWGNTIGRMVSGTISRTPLRFGEQFSPERYPVKGSDLLAHLVHEHQAGFVNRVIEAAYLARAAAHAGEMPSRESARELARYILFADEAPLPAALQGDPSFKNDFLAKRKHDSQGRSLKDFDLQSRLFKYRCSYMIYTPMFQALPVVLKQMVSEEIRSALDGKTPGYDYIPPEERAAIRSILGATIDWFNTN